MSAGSDQRDRRIAHRAMAQYTLISELGQGGMGVVYRALQQPLGREVALKFLLSEISGNADLIKRFQREVEVCIRLAHPNIIKVLDSGEMDGRYFYVMEYLREATALDQLIKIEGPFPDKRGLEITLQLLDALDYVHGQNVLHRDIKPANVMVGTSGHVTLMDFGLVKDVVEHTLLTVAGRMIGTPRYMAPEQVRCEQVGPAADLWSVGVVLYEMITRQMAFPGDNVTQITHKVLKSEPVAPSEMNPELAPDIDALVLQFLRKDPARRVPSARVGIDLIRSYLDRPRAASGGTGRFNRSGAGTKRTGGRVGVSAPGASSHALSGSRPRPHRSHRSLVWVAGLASGMLVTLLVMLAPWAGRPVPVPVASGTPSPAVRTRPLTVDRVHWSATLDRGSVECVSSRPATLTAELQPVVGGQLPRVERERTPYTNHQFRLAGLVAGTEYRLRILDDQGGALHTQTVATATPARMVAAAVRALETVDPAGLAARLEATLAAGPGSTRRDLEIRRWEQAVRQAHLKGRLDASTEPLRGLKNRIYREPSIPGRDRWKLFGLAADLSDLEELAGALGAKVDRLSDRLLSAEYGQIEAPRIPAPSGVALILEGTLEYKKEIRYSRPVTSLDVEGRPRDRFVVTGPSTDATVPTTPTTTYVHPLPIPLPPRLEAAGLEVHAALEGSVAFRVLVSTIPDGGRDPWRLLALLKPRMSGRHVVYHTLPPDVFTERPIYLRIEPARSPGASRQEGRLKWILLGYTPIASPSEPASDR